MKKLCCLLLAGFVLACSSDDSQNLVENGSNPIPNRQRTGSSARDFLSADAYARLEIEILYVSGFAPTNAALDAFRTFLEARLNKPGGVGVTLKEIASPGTSPYTLQEIQDIERANRTAFNDTGILTLCILFVDGKSTQDTDNSAVLGTAYLNTSCVIYENSVIAFSTGPNRPPRWVMESTVLQHEICHLFGLVDFGTPMQAEHEDDAHQRHCDNSECLMYWAVQARVMDLQMVSVPQLDANCVADLQGNGGK